MEQVKLTGSQVVEAVVEDQYESKDSGKVYGTAIIDGERVPVLKYTKEARYWYCDVGEVVQ